MALEENSRDYTCTWRMVFKKKEKEGKNLHEVGIYGYAKIHVQCIKKM